MPQKKPQRNGFYWFMQDIMPELRREGRVFPNGMSDVVPVALPRWKLLSPDDKERYENKAKEEKKKNKGPEGDKHRLDNQGNIIAQRKDQNEEAKKREAKEKRIARSRWPAAEEMLDFKFYFIAMEYLCKKQDHGSDIVEYLPCEIGMVEFTMRKGITKTFHCFVKPGPIPLGFRYECVSHSEETHQIPVEGFDKQDDNYKGIWIRMENFVNPNGEGEYPPIYAMGANLSCVEYSMEWIHEHACLGYANRLHKIFKLENMVSMLFDYGGETMEQQAVTELITRPFWDYEPNTRCSWHEEQEVKFCALFACNRFVYALSETLADVYKFQLGDGHRPKPGDQTHFTAIIPTTLGFGGKKTTGFGRSNPPPPNNRSNPWQAPPSGGGGQSQNSGPYASRDVRYQKKTEETEDFGDEDYQELQLSQSIRRPRIPGDDFGASSNAWAQSTTAGPAASAWATPQEWPGLGRGSPVRPGGDAVVKPTLSQTVSQSSRQAGDKTTVAERLAQQQQQQQPQQQRQSNPPQPVAGSQFAPGQMSNPRHRLGAPRQVNSAGRGAIRAGLGGAPNSAWGPRPGGPPSASVAHPAAGDQSIEKEEPKSRLPSSMPHVLAAAQPKSAAGLMDGGSSPSRKGLEAPRAVNAWGRGMPMGLQTSLTANAGVGRGRGNVAVQPVSIPPGFGRPPPGFAAGASEQLSELDINA